MKVSILSPLFDEADNTVRPLMGYANSVGSESGNVD